MGFDGRRHFGIAATCDDGIKRWIYASVTDEQYEDLALGRIPLLTAFVGKVRVEEMGVGFLEQFEVAASYEVEAADLPRAWLPATDEALWSLKP